MRDHLRKLAEAATPGPWEVKDTQDIYRLDVQDQCGSVVCLVPQVEINNDGGETDEGEWAARTWNDAAFIAAASPDVVLGLLDRIDMLVRMNLDTEEERDEAREAVRRLVGALDDIGCGAATLPGYNMNDAIPTIVAVLNDPVVRRIVEVCPSCHQHEGNHTIECDNNAQ